MADATFDDLFGSDILLHYDASDAASLFTDTGGTSAASDGNEVKCIKPQSDAVLSVNLTNATGPTYRSNYTSSGYPALQFDGVNDALVNASTGLASVTRFFVLCALTPISGAGTAWSRGSSASFYSRIYINTAPSYFGQSQGSSVFSQSATFASGKIVLATVYGDSQNEINGLGVCVGTTQTGTVSASLSQKFSIGCTDFGGGNTQFGTFAFHEILVIGSTCEWGQVLRGAKILRNKWGITDPNALPQASSGGTSGFTGLSGVGRLGT